MSTLRIALLATSAIALASAAHAADMTGPVTTSWTGLYAGFGIGGGYAFGSTNGGGAGEYHDYSTGVATFDAALSPHVSGVFNCDADYCSGQTGAAAGNSSDQGQAGFLGRAEIGGDYQFDRIVAGVNASFTLGDRQMSSSGSGSGGGSYYENEDDAVGGSGAAGSKSKVDVGNSWSLGARLGYLISDSTLLFGTVGYTQASTSIKSSFQGVSTAGIDDGSNISAAYAISAKNDDWLGGYYIGTGLETMLMDHMSLKLEYRYADYGSISAAADESVEDCVAQEGCAGYGAGTKSKTSVTDQTVMATVSFRM